MEEFYKEILQALQAEDKQEALRLCMDALEEKKISVADLYENVLSPALSHVIEEYPDTDDLIWREHIRSGIIRTIIESAYPYVIEERKEPNGEQVVVMCPEYEDHELGARMATDFYRLEGFDATFVGARTPLTTVLKALDIVQPKYLVISVTNFFNFISVRSTVETLKKEAGYDLTIILGGRAVEANPDVANFVGADLALQNYEAIQKLSEGVN